MQLVRPLSDEDLAILELERGPVVGHTCKLLILERPVDVDELRASIALRLDAAPELSLRLQDEGGTLWWARAGAPELREHVIAHEGEPLGAEALRSAVARLFEQRLDRERPLWRIDVLPRLADGGGALVWRIHHALADGTTVMRIARDAVWDEPEVESRPRVHQHAGSDQLEHVQRLLALAHEAPHPWQRSPFDGEIDSKRSIAFATGELESLHRVATTVCGATVNDAVLTVVSGGLRRWLEAAHCPVGPVRVKVPVSLHGADHDHDHESPGNRDSYFCLDLPLGPPDPAVRLETIHRATKARKQDHDAEQLDALMQELAKASPRLRRFADHVMTSPRSFALNVSNVPGPRRPIEVLGVPVSALYAIAEIGQRHALRIAVLSLAGTLSFGLCADPTLLPDVEQLAAAIEEEAAALCAIPATT
jgi:hypothetical protein